MEVVHKKKIIGMDVLQKTILSDRYLMISFNAEQLTGMSPGDHIAIYPKNNEKEVEGLMGQLKDLPDLEAQIQLSSKNSPIGTIRQLLTTYYDINALVSQEDLELVEVSDSSQEEKDDEFEALRLRRLRTQRSVMAPERDVTDDDKETAEFQTRLREMGTSTIAPRKRASASPDVVLNLLNDRFAAENSRR